MIYLSNISSEDIVSAISIGWLWSISAPIHPFLGVVYMLVFTGIITTVLAAMKHKERIEDEQLWSMVYKLSSATFLLLASLYFHEVFGVGSMLTYSFSIIICTAELKTIARNVGRIWGVDLWGVVTQIIFKKKTK